MAKKKRNSTISFVAFLTVAAIVAVYLACYTFARYSTSAGNSTASSIALWDVTITPQTNTTENSAYSGAISFGKLSPGTAKTLADDDSGYIVKNTSESVYLANFKYNTDVDLSLCIESSDFSIEFSDGSTLTTNSYTGENSQIAYYVYIATDSIIEKSIDEKVDSSHNYSTSKFTPTLSDIISLYELDFYVGSVAAGKKFSKDTNSGYDFYDFNSGSGSCSIYGTLSWQIYVENYSLNGDYSWATYLCDWVGKYVTNVSCTITYSAVQASSHIQE